MGTIRGMRGLAAVLLFIGTIVLFWGAAPAQAEGEFNVYAHVESFVWKEFDGTTQLLKESGPLYGIGFTFHGDIGDEYSALTLTPRIELFGGSVDYDGQTQDGVPVKTDTGYFGFKLEFDIGGKFGKSVNIEPFLGLGIRDWWRNINDGFDVTGRPVSGYVENWDMIYGRAGLRGGVDFSKNSRMFFEAVARIPIYNENTAYLSDIDFAFYDDVTLEPGKVVTLFAEVGIKLHVFKMSVFYEGMQFGESKHVFKYNGFYDAVLESWQPKSTADIYGVRIGAAF